MAGVKIIGKLLFIWSFFRKKKMRDTDKTRKESYL